MKKVFEDASKRASDVIGSPWGFVGGVLLVIAWATVGPYFHWSDSHSLFINTTTTIITFLAIFLLQRSQNDDTQEIKDKMDAMLKHIDDQQRKLRIISHDVKELELTEKADT